MNSIKFLPIPHTKCDVFGHEMNIYDTRFFGHVRYISELNSSFCPLALMKISLIIGELYSGSIFPMGLKEDWRQYKKGDWVICDFQEQHPSFYMLKYKDLLGILETPVQFRYHYKIIYDVEKENNGIGTPTIDILRDTEWLSLDEAGDAECFMSQTPLIQNYPIEMRLDNRITNNETYRIDPFSGTSIILKSLKNKAYAS